VHLDEPSWWYGAASGGLTASLLGPIGALYGLAAKARYERATPYRCRLPVVCIGNFTAGGTGKTPLALHICKHLKDAGHEPVALTRGYGGGMAGPYWVNARTDSARDVGDEALLLARAGPTLVARNRRLGARAIETGPHPATVIVMDDGLQNPQLAKDLTIALIDGTRGIGNGLVIPAGPLRAPLDFQLELTGAIVINEPVPGAGDAIAERMRNRFAGPVLRATTTAAADAGWLKGQRVVAWAGIGAPQRFFGMLAHLGAEVVEAVAFRDHQSVQVADAERLLALAAREKALLVTTEKDLARLAGSSAALMRRLAELSRPLPIRLAFADAEAVRLASLLDTALKARAST
jgi:tetraacyldisaccharide 4'-kinase